MDEMQEDINYVDKMLERSSMVLGAKDIDKITNTKVALAGFGGVGSIVAELLARWGIKHFRLFDKDKYESSNLNRQLFATSKTIGQPKAKQAAKRIIEINPRANIDMMFHERSTYENTEQFINGADIVVQTTDQPSSLLFYKAAQKYKVPLVNGYVDLKGCYITFFDYKNSKCLCWREKLKDYYKWRNLKSITKMNDKELDDLDATWNPGIKPSFNFITNLCGCLLVGEVFKYITGKGNVCYYPKRVELDCISWKLKLRNAFPLVDIANITKMFKYISRGAK